MTIPPDLEAQILRYYHVEKWRIGTIARQLRGLPDEDIRNITHENAARLFRHPLPA